MACGSCSIVLMLVSAATSIRSLTSDARCGTLDINAEMHAALVGVRIDRSASTLYLEAIVRLSDMGEAPSEYVVYANAVTRSGFNLAYRTEFEKHRLSDTIQYGLSEAGCYFIQLPFDLRHLQRSWTKRKLRSTSPIKAHDVGVCMLQASMMLMHDSMCL